MPAAVLAAPGEGSPRAAGTTFYVNFDGAVISGGADDASTNTSEVAQMFGFSGPYPAYGGSSAERAAVLAATRADWEDFDVEIVDTRPGQAPYAMAVIGPIDPFGPGLNAASPVDCWDENRSSVGFVFFGAEDLGGSASTAVQAANLSSVFAHAVGLEHVTGSGADADIMYPNPSSPTAAFVDACYVLAMGAVCQDMHTALSGCGQDGEQNSYQELLSLLGPAQTDTESPSVSITAPDDGAEFDLGAAIDVIVAAEDDVGVAEVELALDGESLGVLEAVPYAWTLEDVEPGEHTIVAAARDEAGNETISAAHTLLVDAPADNGPEPTGCRCASHRRASAASWLWLVALLPLRRRRRIALRTID